MYKKIIIYFISILGIILLPKSFCIPQTINPDFSWSYLSNFNEPLPTSEVYLTNTPITFSSRSGSSDCNSFYNNYNHVNVNASKGCWLSNFKTLDELGDFLPNGLVLTGGDMWNNSSRYVGWKYDFETPLEPGVEYTLTFRWMFDLNFFDITRGFIPSTNDIVSTFLNFSGAGNFVANFELSNSYQAYSSVSSSISYDDGTFDNSAYDDCYSGDCSSGIAYRVMTYKFTPTNLTYNILMQSYYPADSNSAYSSLSFGNFFSSLYRYYYPIIETDLLSSMTLTSFRLGATDSSDLNINISHLPSQGRVVFNECHDPNDLDQSHYIRKPSMLEGTFYYWNGSTSDLVYSGIQALSWSKLTSTTPNGQPYYFVNYDLSLNNSKGLNFLSIFSVGQRKVATTSKVNDCSKKDFFNGMACGVNSSIKKFTSFIASTISSWFSSPKISSSDDVLDVITYENYVCSFYVPNDSYSSIMEKNYDSNNNVTSFNYKYKDENGNIIDVQGAYSSLSIYHSNGFNYSSTDSFNVFSSNFSTILTDFSSIYSRSSSGNNLHLFLTCVLLVGSLLFILRRLGK